MEALFELKKWVEVLDKGERRSVTLLGQSRAGAGGSQHLQLFEWLCQHDPSQARPDPVLMHNLPTLSRRLRALILDALRLARRDLDTDARLSADLQNAAILMDKRLNAPAAKGLRALRQQATTASRYGYAIQAIALERRLLAATQPADHATRLLQLRKDESALHARLADLSELQHRHEMLRQKTKDMLAPRTAEDLQEVRALAQGDWLAQMAEHPAFLEHALAHHLLAIGELLLARPADALARYRPLLAEWATQPFWQRDQGPLLYHISVMHLIACITAPLQVEEAKGFMELLPGFGDNTSALAQEYQHTLRLHAFAFTMNSGQMALLQELLPATEQWYLDTQPALPPRLQMAYVYNFSVCRFILGEPVLALRWVMHLLAMPDSKVRRDLREAALVLRSLLLYECGERDFAEYVVRSGKRHFQKNARAVAFELAIHRCIERAIQVDGTPALASALQRLDHDLSGLNTEGGGTAPLPGLNEARLWLRAKREGKALREVFVEMVRDARARTNR